MSTYRYLCGAWPLGSALTRVPLGNVSIVEELEGPGSVTARFPVLESQPTEAAAYLAATEPAKSVLYVDRDGVLVFGGLIWRSRPVKGEAHEEIYAEGFWSWFRRQILPDTLNWSYGADQLHIARSTVAWYQATAPRVTDMGVQVGVETSGVIRHPVWPLYDQKYLGSAIEELAATDNGFDLSIDVAWEGSPAAPTRRLRLWYPRRGTQTGIVFQYPGNILEEPEWPRDGAAMSTVVWGQGAGQGDTLLQTGLLQSQHSPRAFANGYPALASTASWNEANPALLTARLKRRVAEADGPINESSIVVAAGPQTPTDTTPPYGSYHPGDVVRVRGRWSRFPAGLDVWRRIVRTTLTPDDEKVAIALAPVVT